MLQPSLPQISPGYGNPSTRIRRFIDQGETLCALQHYFPPIIRVNDLLSPCSKEKTRNANDLKKETLKEVRALMKELVVRNKRLVQQSLNVKASIRLPL